MDTTSKTTWPTRWCGSAVERQFEIIGESFSGLRPADPDLAACIPDLPRIVAFRTVLIHGANLWFRLRYAMVDDRLVWSVVEGSLPKLLALLAHLLGEQDGNAQP